MASEEAEPAVIAEAIAARASDLVRALLAPGGLLSVEDAAETVANSVRSRLADFPRKNLAVRSQDIEELAVAAAAGALSALVYSGAGSLTAPHDMVEEAITKAVRAAGAQVGDTSTSSAYSFAFWYLVVTFSLGLATLAMLAMLLVRLA